jgi:glycosyltransferase involved in cell wall biosynthesis
VDDGSTDESREILSRFSEKNSNIELLLKDNGGQLSCFNAAAHLIQYDEVVFFLDSDDFFPKDHLEQSLGHFENNLDVLICEVSLYSENKSFPSFPSAEPYTFQNTSAITRSEKLWIGAPTSALVIVGAGYKKIFPYDDEKNWITRADDVIVYASSIMGMKKKYVPNILVYYRVHDSNSFFGKKISKQQHISRAFSIEKLFYSMCNRANVPLVPSCANAYLEIEDFPASVCKKFNIPDKKLFLIRKWIERLNRIFIRN